MRASFCCLLAIALCTSAASSLELPKALKKPDLVALAKKAEAGDAAAQYQLGLIHYEGVHAEFSPEKTIAMWRKAARGGHTEAMYRLGEAYDRGFGVGLDTSTAARRPAGSRSATGGYQWRFGSSARSVSNLSRLMISGPANPWDVRTARRS